MNSVITGYFYLENANFIKTIIKSLTLKIIKGHERLFIHFIKNLTVSNLVLFLQKKKTRLLKSS